MSILCENRNKKNGSDLIPAVLLPTLAYLYISSVGDTGIIYDALNEPNIALQNINNGLFPRVGSEIGGFGFNGPAATLLNMVALSVFKSEWAIPLAGLVSFLTVSVLCLLLLRDKLGTSRALWIVCITVSNPFILEWSRSGIDLTWLALAILPGFWAVRRLTQSPTPFVAAFAGLILGIASNFQFMVFFVAFAAGLVSLRHNQKKVPLIAFAICYVVPFLGVLTTTGIKSGSLSWLPISEFLFSTFRMLVAPSVDSYVRAQALSSIPPVIPALATAIPLVVFILYSWRWRKRNPVWTTIITSIVLGYLFLGFSEYSHYHHILHLYLLCWMIQVFYAFWSLDQYRVRRKWLAAAVICINIVSFNTYTSDAAANGSYLFGNIFPVSQPSMPTRVPTLKARTLMNQFLKHSGLRSQKDVAVSVAGPNTYLFAETAWFFLNDKFDHSSGERVSPGINWLWFGDCSRYGFRISPNSCIRLLNYKSFQHYNALTTPLAPEWKKITNPHLDGRPFHKLVPTFYVITSSPWRFPIEFTADTTIFTRTLRAPGLLQDPFKLASHNLNFDKSVMLLKTRYGYLTIENEYAIHDTSGTIWIEGNTPLMFEVGTATGMSQR